MILITISSKFNLEIFMQFYFNFIIVFFSYIFLQDREIYNEHNAQSNLFEIKIFD